jgi:hypothetical protein
MKIKVTFPFFISHSIKACSVIDHTKTIIEENVPFDIPKLMDRQNADIATMEKK